MPLEQIRPSFQVYQPSRSRDSRQHNSSMPFEYDGDEEEEADEMDQPITMTRPQDMNLLKLGGVGGVTRSGSWGQNLSSRDKTRETFLSSLTRSPVQVADAIEDEEADSTGNMARSHSMILNQQKKALIDHSRSFSSDLPVISKDTAASYSAAAFSLRSLSSHRSSISSASSSGATSSLSHHTASPASETGSMGTKTTSRRMSQAVSASTSSGSTTGTAQGLDFFQPETADRSQQVVSPPSSVDNHQVGPGVNRVLSIGRGYRETKPLNLVPPDSTSPHKSSISPTDSVKSIDNNEELLKALTLSAAAATPDLSTSLQSSSSSFTPPAPRRHTGAYSLRSQSALSQSGGALGSSWGGSGGRAAAREMAQTSKSYDNAPFSQLEARRAMEIASTSQKDPSSLLTPTRSDREPTRDRLSFASSSEGFSKRKAPRMSEGLSASRPTTLDTLSANVPLSTSLSSLNTMGLGIDTKAIAASRPGLPRTNTVTNVLRTPTTEEWSRFLVKQGLDPATVAAGKTGRSKRISLNQRKHPLNTISSPSMNADFVAAALSEHQENSRPRDSEMPLVGGSSEEEDSGQESMKEMTGQRAISRSSSSQIDLSIYDEDSDSDGEIGSSSFERMQALHDAISRPPSRKGSPPPLLDFEHMAAFEAIMKPTEEHQRIRRLTRESSFAAMGYPPSPIGERRNIDDFVVLSDIGRGAYGLVKRVQLKNIETGKGYGPEFCIKYIIKSRILADCWRRHKILGPIPIEIHVMDQLRRLHYKPTSLKSPWSVDTLLGLKHEQQPSEDTQLNECVGHPSLCKMLDFFEDHEFYYMVMPCFGKGQDLFDYIESQPHGLSSLQVRSIFGQVADGLKFLHQNNIVHRDIKDENVILDGNGHAQIIDFGSAAHVNKSGRLFDTFSGTLDYAASEILKGEKYAGKEQDVWALGVVGYVLLCGDCPFWNGQEAIQGLQFNTRAYRVLQERCRAIPSIPMMSPEQSLQEEEVEKRESDRLGQVDGGGKIEDGADLIQRCLELEIAMRPTMDIVCQHRFLIGNKGWSGPGGWRQMGDIAASSSSSITPSE